MGPIDYIGQVQNPFASAVQGYQLGSNIQAMEAQKQAQALALQQQQAEMERKRQIQEASAALMRNPNPTARDFINLASMLPEKEAASMRANWETLSKEQKDAELSFGTQVLSAVNAGKVDIGVRMLRDRAEAEKDPAKKRAYETYAQLAEVNPEAASKTIGLSLAAIPEGQKVLEGLTKLGAEERAKAEEARKTELQPLEVAQRQATISETAARARIAESDAKFRDDLNKAGLNEKNWAIKNLQSQIGTRGAQLQLDRQRLALDTQVKLAEHAIKLREIPTQLQPEINKAAVSSAASRQEAQKASDLAKKIEDIGTSWGALGSTAEALKRLTGNQNALSDLRDQYDRLKNAGVINNLPPGAASDKDIEFAAKGIPPSTANPASIASYLRGIAKMQTIASAVDAAKVDWMVNNNGLLRRANDSFIAGDLAAKPGETFPEFSSRIAEKVNKDLRPRPAAPAAPPVSAVRSSADAILSGGR